MSSEQHSLMTVHVIKYNILEKMLTDINTYIHCIYEDKEDSQKSHSNEERLKQLEKWLKDKNYKDYVETLNEMLKDPKACVLLKDGFGGELGDIEFTFTPRVIRVGSLMPTQSEIDINKSLKYALTKPQKVRDDFHSTIILNNMPIVTFRGNYVIDGHHRWAETVAINPDGRMLCFDYDAEISAVQMLKALQGAIAAVYASKDDKEKKLPKSTASAQNIYDSKWGISKIRKWIDKTITNDVVKMLCKYYPKCSEKDDVVKIITDNVIQIKINNPPVKDAPKREDMPQPAKAGKDPNDKKTSTPDKEGSALNKLRDGSFDSNIL